jgi:hypothetical protein
MPEVSFLEHYANRHDAKQPRLIAWQEQIILREFHLGAVHNLQ